MITCRCNPSLICHRKPPRSEEGDPSPPSNDRRNKPIRSRSTRAADFGDIPAELLPTILSRLDAKQAASTSVLSTAWRHAWRHSPGLTLDMAAVCGAGYRPWSAEPGEKHYRALLDGRRCVRFVHAVDAALRQRGGDAVEQLELRFDVECIGRLSRRLDDWLRRAVSSQTKSLTIDVSLRPHQVYGHDRYKFPLQLLDGGGGVSSLQHLHLSCASLKAPSSSRLVDFPKLRRLRLCSVAVPASDLGHVLSNCPNLEWLDLYRIRLNADHKLIVERPLPRLLHLSLLSCGVNKIQLNASRLKTFIFQGQANPLPPIYLHQSSGLHDVNIHCSQITLQQALSSLPGAFPMVRLSLGCTNILLPDFPWRLENTSMFSHLMHLQLIFNIGDKHANDTLSIAYFLRAAPLLEDLYILFVSCCMDGGEGPLRSLPQGQSEYKCLKNFRVCQFRGKKSQVELLVHIVENAPALEILTIDPRRQLTTANFCQVTEAEKGSLSKIRRMATTFIAGKLSAKTKFVVV